MNPHAVGGRREIGVSQDWMPLKQIKDLLAIDVVPNRNVPARWARSASIRGIALENSTLVWHANPAEIRAPNPVKALRSS